MTRKFLFATAIGSASLILPSGAADFATDVLPVLEQKCMGCHRAPYKTASGRTKKPKGDLRLDNPEEIGKGGDGGTAIVGGNLDESSVYQRVILDQDHDDFMPPQGEGKPAPLTEAELTALKEWIEAGADYGDWTGTEFDAEGNKQ